MKGRCYNETWPAYKNYGAKGVKICDEWLTLDNFYNWSINNGYDEKLTIDRIDSNGNYCPENCRWITLSENVARSNKSNPRRYNLNGGYYGISPEGVRYEFKNAEKFAKEHNLNAGCLRRVAKGERKHHLNWKFGFIK